MMNGHATRDPDDPEDDVITFLELKVRKNGAMSIAGCIDHTEYAIAMLDNARDTIKRRGAQKRIQEGKAAIIPQQDTGLILPPSVTKQ